MIVSEKDDPYLTIYKKCLKEMSKYKKQIKLDVPRTLVEFQYFKDEGNLSRLHNVLYALSCDNKEIGYLQGMNFIAGYFLMRYNSDEIKTFKTITCMLKNDKFGIKGLFISDFPRLFLAIYQIDELLKVINPEVYKHFENIGLTTITWLTSIILTLFAKNLYEIGLDNYTLFMDKFMEHGWITLIKFALVLIQESEPYILEENYENVLIFMNEGLWKTIEFNEIDKLLDDIDVDDDKLHELEIEHTKNISNESPEQKKKSIGFIICSLLFGLSSIIMRG